MIARIRSFALAAALAVVAFLTNLRDNLVNRLPVSIDRTLSGLEAIVDKLGRAIDQQYAVADREVRIQEASYAREDAAVAAAERATRARNRIEKLLG